MEVHNRLIVAIADFLAPQLRPRYRVAIEKRITVALPMPEQLTERYLEVRDVATGEVVTALEMISPSNKRSGEGRKTYESKRQRVLSSLTHFIEIDLIRGLEPMPLLGTDIQSNYRILVSRAERRPLAELYPFGIQAEIPSFPLPLRSEDAQPWVDLQIMLSELYDRAGYDLAVNYSSEPVPPLQPEDAVWTDALLRQKGLR